jgi:hypothetical protein
MVVIFDVLIEDALVSSRHRQRGEAVPGRKKPIERMRGHAQRLRSPIEVKVVSSHLIHVKFFPTELESFARSGRRSEVGPMHLAKIHV